MYSRPLNACLQVFVIQLLLLFFFFFCVIYAQFNKLLSRDTHYLFIYSVKEWYRYFFFAFSKFCLNGVANWFLIHSFGGPGSSIGCVSVWCSDGLRFDPLVQRIILSWRLVYGYFLHMLIQEGQLQNTECPLRSKTAASRTSFIH